MGIQVRGTLGLVLLAKRQGRIAAAAPVLDQLQVAGMYLSNAVVRQALALVDERAFEPSSPPLIALLSHACEPPNARAGGR